MIAGMYSAASALEAATRNQEVIAHNLAHMNVPGFRRSEVAFGEFEALLSRSTDQLQPGLGTEAVEIRTDFTPGALNQTGRKLDLALQGEGFFVIEGPAGPLYTRSGVFHLTAAGDLVNAEGLAVMGDEGPIQVPPSTSPSEVAVSSAGNISVDGRHVATLRVVAFDQPQRLMQVGSTSFEAPAELIPADADVGILQGSRESSNVSPVMELTRMIIGLRHHEASQRALQSINDAVQLQTTPDQG